MFTMAFLEFGEWMSDLNTKMSHVGSHIPGFRKVHLGFKFVDLYAFFALY